MSNCGSCYPNCLDNVCKTKLATLLMILMIKIIGLNINYQMMLTLFYQIFIMVDGYVI